MTSYQLATLVDGLKDGRMESMQVRQQGPPEVA